MSGRGAQVFIGRLVKAVGIRGELKLDPSDDFWEGALHSERLMLILETEAGIARRSFVVERFRPQKTGYVVKARGVSDRDRGEELVGGDVVIDAAEIDVELPKGVLPFQVLGARVRKVDGKVIGEVTSVLHSPAHNLFEITGPLGRFMVPAVPEFIKSIDERNKELVIDIIPGLIDEESNDDENFDEDEDTDEEETDE